MLFHITQVHTPESCPRDEGGSNSLYDHDVPGVRLIGRYGANAQHTLFLVVEADDVNAIHKFLWPGLQAVHEHDHPRERGPCAEGMSRRAVGGRV